jgi:hypothetical protein
VTGRAAAWLLVPLPVGAAILLALVRAKLIPADPSLVLGLGIFPLAALVIAWRERDGGGARRAWIVAGLVELALLVPLHGLVTFIRAWRLEGG